MKTTDGFLLKLIAFALVNMGIANAQKLPNKQGVSLRAPANIKIDGRLIEWNDRFQAYNNATDVFYSIANDDKNLYLAVRADYLVAVNKMTFNGMNFSIQDSKKKNKGISITYPLLQRASKFETIFTYNKTGQKSEAEADTLMNNNNNALKQRVKFIRVANIEGIDTLISIYNTYGIEAAGLFDKKSNYTCEIAIPLKYLSALIDASGKITYHIQLNGNNDYRPLVISSDNQPVMVKDAVNKVNGMMQLLSVPTSFSGEYTVNK